MFVLHGILLTTFVLLMTIAVAEIRDTNLARKRADGPSGPRR